MKEKKPTMLTTGDGSLRVRFGGAMPSTEGEDFGDGAAGLIDGDVGVGAGSGVGVGDGDAAEGLAADDPRLFVFFPRGIEKRVGCVGIAVGPAVYGDALDVSGGIETSAAEHTSQLIAGAEFKFGEGRSHELDAPGAELVAHGQARLTGCTQHEEDHGLVGMAGEFVLAQADGKVQGRVAVIAARGNNLADAEFRE